MRNGGTRLYCPSPELAEKALEELWLAEELGDDKRGQNARWILQFTTGGLHATLSDKFHALLMLSATRKKRRGKRR